MLPNTKLPIHTDNTGPSTNSMAVNMGLVSLDSGLYVKKNGKFRSIKHEDGKLIVFNSEMEHYADNKDMKNIRYIIYIDFNTKT